MSEQKYLSGPHIQVAVLCEKILMEGDGALSIIRIIDRLTITGPTPEMPPFPYAVLLFISFKSGFYRGKAQIKVIPISPLGKELTTIGFPLLFEGDDERGSYVKGEMRILLQEEGLYWFEIQLESTNVTRIPLRVVYQQVGSIPKSEG